MKKKRLKIENMAVDSLIRLLNDPETPDSIKEQILDMLDSFNDSDQENS
jgi:hypothetical protein